MGELKNQPCPICNERKANLREEEVEVPYFGKVFIFSVDCEDCKYHKSDIEVAGKKEPCRYTFEVGSEEDLNVKVVKSGEATVKILYVITMEPGTASDGYITNVEGLLERVKKAIESVVDEEDEAARKKAKNLIKKLNNAMLGRETLKIIIEDPSGNSAIISEKAVKSRI